MSMSCSAFFLYHHLEMKCSFLLNLIYSSSVRAAKVSYSLQTGHGKGTCISQTGLGVSLGQESGLSLVLEPRLPHAEGDISASSSVYLWGLSEGDVFVSGNGLIIFRAQSMSHLEPMHGGCLAGIYSVIKTACLPSFALPLFKSLVSVLPFNTTEKQQDHIPI